MGRRRSRTGFIQMPRYLISLSLMCLRVEHESI